MKDIKKEINSRLMGDRTRVDYMADVISAEMNSYNNRLQAIENALSVMQEAMIRMEATILTPKEENEKPKRRRIKKG
jgi:hypothetical protein